MVARGVSAGTFLGIYTRYDTRNTTRSEMAISINTMQFELIDLQNLLYTTNLLQAQPRLEHSVSITGA